MDSLSPSDKNKMRAARDLLREKRYVEAKSLLQGINHPTAYEWLRKIDQILGSEPNRILPSPPPIPSQQYPIEQRYYAPAPQVNEQLMQYIIAMFVRNHWMVTTQTNNQASLEKSVSSVGLSVLLGVIALLILFFYSMLVGVLCIVGSLMLIALNNATKRRGTAHITALPDGSVRVVSNNRSLDRIYSPGFAGRIKT